MGAMISAKAAGEMVDALEWLYKVLSRWFVQTGRPKKGFVTPGIVDVTGVEGLEDEEHFGPLLKVYRYKELDDAIKEANNTALWLVGWCSL